MLRVQSGLVVGELGGSVSVLYSHSVTLYLTAVWSETHGSDTVLSIIQEGSLRGFMLLIKYFGLGYLLFLLTAH